MDTLSQCEYEVAKEYCKGYTDKEVADVMRKSIWTIRAQKRDIYKKLRISKDTELVLYMLCDRLKVNFDLKELRKHGLELFFSILFIVIQVSDYQIDMRRCRIQARSRTALRTSRGGTRRNNELDLSNNTI